MSWTRRAARARSLRRLKSLMSKTEDTCLAIAHEWADVDEYVCGLCDELRNQYEGWQDEIREALDWAGEGDGP